MLCLDIFNILENGHFNVRWDFFIDKNTVMDNFTRNV